MKKLITIIVCVLTLSFASMATASIIDFDDINTGAPSSPNAAYNGDGVLNA